MKKIFLFFSLFILILGISIPSFVLATAEPRSELGSTTGAQKPFLEINFFYSSICLHCAAEEIFLQKIEKKYPEIKINSYHSEDEKNQKLLQDLCKKCGVEKYLGLVPMTFVGDEFFLGFDNEKEIGTKIENSIKRQLEGGPSEKINLPSIGGLEPSKYSLPIFTIVLGLLDGFNVCSLGALVMILGLTLALRNRKKILILGGTYILTAAVVYALLIFFWYRLFTLLVPYLRFIQVLVGLLAILSGVYFVKEFIRIRKQGATCEINGKKITNNLASRLENSLKRPKNVFFLIGSILIFATLLTLIEFPCSAAVPLVFAGVLAKASLTGLQYLFYIILYIFFYMFDEIIIFLIAVFSLKLWLTSPKFVAWSDFVEAIILFVLGLYYLIGF